MEQQTSALLQRLSESATIAMARKANELKQSGIDVISLSLGEPDFDTPEILKQAGIEAIEKNITQYTPTDFSSGSGLITAAQCRLVRADPPSMFGPRSKSCRRFRPSATFQRGRYAACSLAPREA